MSQTTYNKKIRTAWASQLQLTKMIDYFCLNKGLAEGKFNALHGKEESQNKWAELTSELNACQGATKTAEQWQVVWRDLKSRTSIKAKDLRKAKGLTGNKAITQSQMTEFEQRIIGIIGGEYIEGSKYCADSIPEEENLQEELEGGNKSVLSATPQVISVCTNSSQDTSQNSQYSDDDFLNNNDNIELTFDDDCSLNTNSFKYIENENSDAAKILDNCESRKSQKAVTSLSFKINRNAPYPSPASKSAEQSNSLLQHINASTLSKRCKDNRVKPSEQLHSSREHFQSIAQKQADSEMMHAESAKIVAEASKMNALAMTEIAHAITKLADTAAVQAINDGERIRVFEKLTTVLENLLPTYLTE